MWFINFCENLIFSEKFKYYLILLNNTMENVSIKLETNFLSAINKIMKKYNYMTKAEFIREALRDKIRILEENSNVEYWDVEGQKIVKRKL